MESLEERYQRLCEEKSDINEHLPVLRNLSSRCRKVVEIGVRYAVSTTALLAGQPDRLTCVDIMEWPKGRIQYLQPVAGRTNLEFVHGDSREVDLRPMDLLFLDGEHTYECVSLELLRHGLLCSSYIALHDTELAPEVRQAATEFCEQHPFMQLEHFSNNNGLTVLVRRF